MGDKTQLMVIGAIARAAITIRALLAPWTRMLIRMANADRRTMHVRDAQENPVCQCASRGEIEFATGIKSAQEPECGLKTVMLSGRTIYVIGLLQLSAADGPGSVPAKLFRPPQRWN
jgi:hypothetical protein